MRILILGASGLVGGNCLRHFRQHSDWEALGTYFSYPTPGTVKFNTLDANDPENYDVQGFKPDVIVHCGALTWVDYCEEHPEESYEKTVVSTQRVTALAKEWGAKMVYISTDYVFDGETGPYREDDPVNPLSVYGKHKLEAEMHVRETLPDSHLVLRITNVYGDESRHKNFVSRLVQLAHKRESADLKLPMDQYASPCNAYDIARALHRLLEGNKNGVYHIASTDYLNRVQLANRVMNYFDHEQVSLTPVTTEQLNQPAKRPLLGGFVAEKFNHEFPDFRWSNIDDYLQKLANRTKQ